MINPSSWFEPLNKNLLLIFLTLRIIFWDDLDHVYKVSYKLLIVSLKLSFASMSNSSEVVSGKTIDKFFLVTLKGEKILKKLNGKNLKKISKKENIIFIGRIDKI